LGAPELNNNDTVGAAVAMRVSPSRRRRLRHHAPTILQPVPAFEVVIEKRRRRSISMLRVALAAVSTGIVASWAAVVGPVVAVERERRRYRGM
jgi:hypothetical protein